jgi:hypothetical protein
LLNILLAFCGFAAQLEKKRFDCKRSVARKLLSVIKTDTTTKSKSMKRITSAFLLITALVACGGGSGTGSSESAVIGAQPIYGFAANGTPYVAKFDLQQGTYSYATLNPETGESFAVTTATLEPTSDPSIKSISGHNQHILAIDRDQSTVLASTRSSVSALPEPTLFVVKPLTKIADIAGTYYLYQNRPFWFRINITGSGTATLDCKSFKLIYDLLPSQYEDDACEGFISGSASVRQLSPPFWELKYQIKASYGTIEDLLESTSIAVFSNTSKGKVAYLGAGFGKSCSNSYCFSHGPMQNTTLLKESQTFSATPTWDGNWAFNRQGGAGALMSLSADGLGKLASGRGVKLTKQTLTNNLDASLMPVDIVSFNTITVTIPTLDGTTTTIANDIYGVSDLDNIGSNLAIVDRYKPSSLNKNAFFDRVPLTLSDKVFSLVPNNTSGPYSIDLGVEDQKRIARIDVFLDTLGLDGTTVDSSTLLSENIDYAFEPFSGRFVFRLPIPSTDINGRQMRLSIKPYLVPIGTPVNPSAWGIRVR